MLRIALRRRRCGRRTGAAGAAAGAGASGRTADGRGPGRRHRLQVQHEALDLHARLRAQGVDPVAEVREQRHAGDREVRPISVVTRARLMFAASSS